MVRGIIGVVVLIAMLGALVTCGVAYFNKKSTEPPKVEDAPYLVQTTSRYYFSPKVTTSEKTHTLYSYWTQEKNKWYFSEDTITLDEKVFGPIRVTRRGKSD